MRNDSRVSDPVPVNGSSDYSTDGWIVARVFSRSIARRISIVADRRNSFEHVSSLASDRVSQALNTPSDDDKLRRGWGVRPLHCTEPLAPDCRRFAFLSR